MDAELRTTTASREVTSKKCDEQIPAEAAEEIYVLSNLIQSLGASEGAPGPVSNILTEMGIDPPKLRSNDLEESDGE
jgi:hypothetical protein